MTLHDQQPVIMPDPLCQSGHRARDHADAGSSETRCQAVQAREDLIAVFDDGRDIDHGFCACLRFTEAHPLSGA